LILRDTFDSISSVFTGEFDRIVIEGNGRSELIELDSNHGLELPKRGVTELDRLSYLVNAVDQDCFLIPQGSFKMTPIKEIRKNEAFKGLKKDQAFKLESYLHFRKPTGKDKKDLNDRDDAIYNNAFLDDLSLDLPTGTWNLLKDTTE
jgi:radial spoke head protein 9